MGIQVQKGDTLWGIAKQSVQQQTGEKKVTNQQIIDEMNRIAQDSGYESIEDCVNDNFYAKNDKFGSLQVKGLEIEHANENPDGVPEEYADEDVPAEEFSDVPEDGTQQALRNTTLGAVGTYGTKIALKAGKEIFHDPNVREATKRTSNFVKKQSAKIADAAKEKVTKLKARVDAAKVQHARNKTAGAIKDARKANVAKHAAKLELDKEVEKVKNLRAKQKAKQAEITKLRNTKVTVDANGKKITDKKRIEARKARKAELLKQKTAEKEAIAREISTQQKKVTKAKSKKNKATQKANNANKAARNQRAGLKKIQGKKVVKTSGGKVAKASAKKAAKTAAKTGAKKAAAKAAAKATGKTLLKKIPGVGLIAGIAFAIDRAAHGDYAGAAGEIASGAASCLPGAGTVVSTAIDGVLVARDLSKGA